MEDLVSIIVPAYNVEKYIAKCIDSCVNQSYRNVEIVIVNDGSADDTAGICKNAEKKYNNIIYIEQSNQGVSAARNLALSRCNGKYCLFLDSDDWLEEEAVEKLIKEQNKSHTDIVVSECYFVSIAKDGKIIKNRQGINETYEISGSDEVLVNIGTSSKYKLQSSCYKLYDMSIIRGNKLCFNCDIHFGEDGLFTYQYLCHSKNVAYINDALWNILDRPESATRRIDYNPMWISAINAVDLMIGYKNISNKNIYKNLRALRGDRAMWVMLNAIRCDKNGELADIIRVARDSLKKDSFYLCFRDRRLKLFFQIVVLCCCPVFITKKLIH